MSRFTVAAAAISALTMMGATIAFAGVIEDRQATMKSFAPATKEAMGYKSGATPFDAAKVKAVMKVYLDGADKMAKEFPTPPKADEKTKAAPAIWTDAAGFKAALATFKADVTAASNATDQASFSAAFTKVTADCGSCHKAYRLP
jgi:cytochrome c556